MDQSQQAAATAAATTAGIFMDNMENASHYFRKFIAVLSTSQVGGCAVGGTVQ